MKTIKATDDLVLEVWPQGDDPADDRPMLRLRSLAQERDRDTTPGAVVIWPSEVGHLIDALADAAAYLAEEARQ